MLYNVGCVMMMVERKLEIHDCKVLVFKYWGLAWGQKLKLSDSSGDLAMLGTKGALGTEDILHTEASGGDNVEIKAPGGGINLRLSGIGCWSLVEKVIHRCYELFCLS